MTTLHDRLDDAVADVSADLPTLTDASRKQGLSIRRRRRALASVGSLAAVSLLAASLYALAPGSAGSDGQVAVDLANPVRVGPLSGRTARATDGAAAAALVDTVDQVADGTFGRFQSDDGYGSFASLLFLPYDGTGPAGQVMINIQSLKMVGQEPYTCDETWTQTDCQVRELPNGDTVRSYWQLDDSEYGDGSQRMAVEVISPDRGTRIVVNSLNTNPWDDGHYRDQPVLSLEQATEIATRPWWGRRLPIEYVEAGKRLELYEPEG